MFKVIRFLQVHLNERPFAWRSLGALLLGVLLGTLVAVPYDQAFDLSAPPYTAQLYTALQSLVATATLVRVRVVDRVELAVEVESLAR